MNKPARGDGKTEESIITSDGKRLVKVPIRSLEEYRFRFDPNQGKRIGQGDGDSEVGDVIARGKSGNGPGAGQQPGNEPGIDYYEAEVTIDDLAELIFEDLGLPDLRPKSTQEIPTESVRFTEVRKKGPMSNLDRRRTILENLKRNARLGTPGFGNISNDDLRFKVWEQELRPSSSAVVLAMRDASGSMGEFKKYITRSLFFWMKARLTRTGAPLERGIPPSKRPSAEEKPGAILAAALELFAERGFHATNVPLIAERAGVAVGTLYHYFANKEAIGNELYRRVRKEMEKAVYRNLPAGVPPSEQFRVLWQRSVAFAMAKPLAFRFLEMHHHSMRPAMPSTGRSWPAHMKLWSSGFHSRLNACYQALDGVAHSDRPELHRPGAGGTGRAGEALRRGCVTSARLHPPEEPHPGPEGQRRKQ